MQQRIAFIGGGNLATSLIGGLIDAGTAADQIRVSDPSADTQARLAKDFSVAVSADNRSVCEAVDVIVLAVKPQVMQLVCEDIAEAVQANRPLIVSVAAGINTTALARWLGGGAAIARVMPNTPALIGAGAAGVYANAHCSDKQQQVAMAIAEAVGLAVVIDEERLMDAVTAVSGSGPAYFFLAIEALQAAAERQGLAADVARDLACQTALGAARLASESGEPAAELRRKVTSPGGTTEAALGVLEAAGFRADLDQAVEAAVRRSRELSEQLGGKV
jgi:pyrroline-5-carboxylate reductase